MKVSCSNCQFFTRTQPKGGECHFSPPTVLILGMQQVQGLVGLPGANGVQPVVGSHFPPVADTTFCGCFRPAQPQPIAIEDLGK